MRERKPRDWRERPRDWRGVDDFALEALLALEELWERKHRGFPWKLDRWGEGPSRVTFADLGLDARIRTLTLIGVCTRHGKFEHAWVGRYEDEVPHAARCPVVDAEGACEISSRLFVVPSSATAA